MKLIHSTCNNQTATTVFNEYCKQEDITSKNFKKTKLTTNPQICV